ncbi:MAG: hypothetical protein MJ223_00990 [Mycoplasmoidaceae bacterium]|nr:hypothetical protein [Mycoplasmoidaceae bacterium]
MAQTINDLLKAKNKFVDEQDDEEEQEIDAYSYYKESRDDGNLCNLKQEDVDPKIIEGNIIDEQAKQFIKAQFKLESFDFSNINLKESHEQAFEQTKKYLSKNNIILFQPTFINGDLITKPDALVIQDGKATLIEVKGTTNPKISHTFDLYFQFNVIDPIIKLNKCMLCLIKYELLNKKQVSFILNERGSFSKTGFSEPTQIKKLKKEVGPFNEEVIEFKSQVRNASLKEWDYSNPEFNFIDLFTSQIDDKWLEKLPKRVGSRDFLKEELNADAFSSRINELREFQPDDNILPKFEPCLQYKSTLRNADNWLSIRELWLGTTKYFGTQFSGDLLSYSDALLLNKKQ